MIYTDFVISSMHAETICHSKGYHLWHIDSFDEWHQLYSMTGGLFLLFDIIPIGLLCHHQVCYNKCIRISDEYFTYIYILPNTT